jgi:hypothetical protein
MFSVEILGVNDLLTYHFPEEHNLASFIKI